MKNEHKLAATGVGLVAAGFGLGVVGAILIVPAVAMWTAALLEKGADQLFSHADRASRTVGTVAGTIQRSFSEATKAGVAEIRRG
jgi:hypothetical protein